MQRTEQPKNAQQQSPDLTDYHRFISRKRVEHVPCGFDPSEKLINQRLFPWQQSILRWALRKGRASLFLDTGLGKTALQLSYADAVVRHTGKRALLLAPLAVGNQTFEESQKFGINDVHICREGSQVKTQAGITITNYERLHKFDLSMFEIVVPDESSCIKSMDSKTTQGLIDGFSHTPYKLPCTATPAPNDQMELGNHAEFCGAMSRSEMLSMFFVHDGGDTSKWRLRSHARNKFYEWMASWAVAIRKPGDIGYSNEGYDLPPLNFHEHVVASPTQKGQLFATEAKTLGEKRDVRRDTITSRIDCLAGQIEQTSDDEKWLVWCELNQESTEATAAYKEWGAVEVTGSEHMDAKEEKLKAFSCGQIPILVTKGEICGFGMNWQHCRKQGHIGVTDSWEKFYQMIRRSYRFGQTREVDIHVVTSEADQGTVRNLKRKQQEADSMNSAMVKSMGDITRKELNSLPVMTRNYEPQRKIELPAWVKSGW